VTDEHPSLDELAELDEGLLDASREQTLRSHLDGCEQCRAGMAAIASTRQTLGALPPEPMPEEVKARLEDALAAAGSASSTVVPSLDEHRRRRFGRPTAAASAAAAALVLAVGAIIVGHVHHSSNESAGSAAAGAVSGLPESAPPQPTDYVKTSTGTDYTPSRLLADVPSLVANVPGAAQASGTTADASPTSSPSRAPTASHAPAPEFSAVKKPVASALLPLYDSRAKLLSCAAYLTGVPNTVPLAVDFAHWTNGSYNKSPSVVFVMRDANSDVVDVYVTGPTCRGTDAVRTYVKVPLN
jgi:hypothetical protein